MYDVKKEFGLEAVEVANTLGKVGLEYFRPNEVPCYKSGIVVKHWNNRKHPMTAKERKRKRRK